jgi:hypothetical protein
VRHQNVALKILMENATDFSERGKVQALMEQELHAVNNTMIGHLYKSAVEKSHVDFDDIPESRGNITRYSGYSSIVQTIETLEEIAKQQGTKIMELDIIEQAISNIAAGREIFEKGFALEKEFIILQYNTLVFAVVEAVSVIISSYVDFVKRPDRTDFVILRAKDRAGYLSIQNLEKFNGAVRQGDFSKVNNSIINSGKENLIGVDDIVVPLIIVGGVLAIVPLVRELIFMFYFSRMRTSDYLEHQAALLEINKNNVESGSAPAKRKAEIVKKQSEAIRKLQRISDKVKIDRITSERNATEAIKKENKNWTIDDVQSQAGSTDSTGFQLL